MIAGKYVVERVLGAGGMGIVYAARHVDLHELFAIKLMRPSEDEGEAASVERFLREARAAARLKSEHVARVHDVGKLDDGTPYMVMEHLEGIDLRKLFKSRRAALPIAELIDYVIQACEAIAEAHAAGIIHRDLKPANLFLTRRPNGTPCIKVLDFGISKTVGPGKGLDVTNTTDMVGSPFYMAPEQMRSGRSADPRSDIWSLGVVLYELAGGALPFQGDSITEVCARVLQERPMPLASRVTSVPAGFEQIVNKCLEKEPENRFQSVGELSHALRVLQAGEAPAVVPSLPPPSLSGGAPDSRQALASSAAWGQTGTGSAPASGSKVKWGIAVLVCAVAGALGAAAFGALRGGSEPAQAVSPAAPDVSVTGSVQPAPPLSATAIASGTSVPATASASAEPALSASANATARPVKAPAASASRPRIVDYGDRH